MQLRNNYELDVYNGDTGFIRGIDKEKKKLVVVIEGREVTYGFQSLDQLTHAFACTIHKSQGSEYPAVVIPLLTQHYPMLQRNLVYTGLTRGKRLVVGLLNTSLALPTVLVGLLGQRGDTLEPGCEAGQ